MTKTRIDALSTNQEQLLEQLVSSLRVDALPPESTQPDQAEAAIKRLYRACKLPRPQILWCENPFQLSVMPILLELLLQQEERIGYSRLLDETQKSEPELESLLTNARWKSVLECLRSQISADLLHELAQAEAQQTGPFAWSKGGVPVSTVLWDQTREHTAHVIKKIEQQLTLSLQSRLTNVLYTVPNDNCLLAKRMVTNHLLRQETLRLRDEALTVFGSAPASLVGLYQRANEFIKQIGGTIFYDLLRAIPIPQADPSYKRPRNLEKDDTVETAAVLGFGPYQSLWGAWNAYATTCYSTIAQLFPGEIEDDARYFLSDMSTLLRCGFAYCALSRVVFVLRFPERIQVDEINRLHNDQGPAMQFRDGYKLHALTGVPVPRELIESPESLTTTAINDVRNVELRRVLIERYGTARYLQDTGAGIMDKSDVGTLYLKQLPGDEALAMVRVINKTPEPDGTYKEYFLRVPPSTRTAREAVAWTFGLTSDEYDPLIES